ncbi:MAG: hypothetical protein DRP42_05930 [Tenericutes bacterium]|nr:MAG: hypothetical protein DRP42_05930 [Mycoplasmatota bacterium]
MADLDAQQKLRIQEDLYRMISEGKKDLFSEPDGHAAEATMLKKAWYNHVLITLEKLDDNIDRLSAEIHETKTALYKEIVDSKDALRTELIAGDQHNDQELDKLEKRLEKALDTIVLKVNELEKSPVKEELEKSLSAIREATNIKLVPIREDLTSLKTKLAIWASLFGVLGAGIVAGVTKLSPYIVKLISP